MTALATMSAFGVSSCKAAVEGQRLGAMCGLLEGRTRLYPTVQVWSG